MPAVEDRHLDAQIRRALVAGVPPAVRTRWLEAGLNAAALIFLPLLVLAPRGEAALASAAGLIAGLLALSNRRPVLPSRLAAAPPLFLVLLCWGATSAAWAPDPMRSLEIAARLAGLFAAGIALAVAVPCVAAPHRLARFLVIGFVLALILAVVDFVGHGALTQPLSTRVYQPAWLNQATDGFAILLMPVAVLLSGGSRTVGLLFGTVAATTVYLLAGSAAKVSLSLGFAVAALVYLWRVPVARIAAVLSVIVVVAAPLTFARLERVPAVPKIAEAVKQSAEHRLLIWSFVGERIAEHPLVGWGLDSSRAIPGGEEPIEHGETWLPLHPHNAPLQLWLELGVPGAALFALVVSLLWLALADAHWSRLYAAAAGGSLGIAFVASLGTYGIWQEWWQGTLWFSLFLVRVLARGLGSSGAERSDFSLEGG